MTTFNLENLSDQHKQMVEIASGNIERLTSKIGPSIDELSSANLKRVLKAITHYSVADNILTGKVLELQEKEQKLIDNILHLQEEILGFMQLSNELGLTQQQDEGENNESEVVE